MVKNLKMMLAFAGVALVAVTVCAAPLANTNELVWTDGANLPQEGRAFSDTQSPYWRIGKKHLANIAPVNGGVAGHASESSGICYRFVTDADELTLRWSLSSSKLGFPHMPATGVSGIDIYAWTPENGWRFVNWRFIKPSNYPTQQKENFYTIKWKPNQPCWIYLPLYNGVVDFAVGVAKGKTIKPLPPRASGVTKPVVFYGSSITQGACASRPGMAFTAIAGRLGDFPVVNLGFSGSARMEPEVCDMLSDVDASCYVLDPLGNMGTGEVNARYEKFVRKLHAAKRDVPIVLSAVCWEVDRPSPRVKTAHSIYEKLKREDPREWHNLHWISEDELAHDDGEYTVDGCHANDWGMIQMGRAHAKAVRTALGLRERASAPIEVGSRLQVLWDDHVVDVERTTASRVMHQPEYAGVAMTHDKPWEGDGCDYHCIVPDRDEKGEFLRMYYNGVAIGCGWKDVRKHFSTDTLRICYAESRDGGVSWVKPSLGLIDFKGSKDNNCILDKGSFGNGWDNFMVFKDENPACPPDERYKGIGSRDVVFNADGSASMLPRKVAIERGGRAEKGLWCFLSADGIHFRLGWLLTNLGAFDTLNVGIWDKTRGEYHLYIRGYHRVKEERNGDLSVRDVRHCTSKDFRTWTKPEMLDFGKDAEDYSLYTNAIEPYFREPSIFVGFPSRYVERKEWTPNFDRLPSPEKRRWRMDHGHKRFGLAVTDCIFIFSRDGLRFNRTDEAFMRPGPENPDNWVYGDCYPARTLVKTPSPVGGDDELSIFTFDRHWLGLASHLNRYRLRQDGFVSRHASYAGQTVVTKPLVFTGSEMVVNFSTSARGRMFVTIRDEAGRSIRSVELFGDKVDRPVDFADGGKVSDFAGRPVTVTFEMSDADIYSFRFR